MDYPAMLEEEDCPKPDSSSTITWKSTLAQLLAGAAVCFTTMSIGMIMAFPTVALGELRQPNKEFSLNENEASWFGSLAYLLQPISSIFGGIINPYVGCKIGLMISFSIQLIGWLFLPWAKSVSTLYIAVILFGVSAGSLEAPSMAYLGEITQPQIRSMILAYSNIALSLGFLFVYLFGSMYIWRTVAAISAAIPVIAMISICFIPESPIWLLNRNRQQEAMKSLCWLRGWVSTDYVKTEYKSMCKYVEVSNHLDLNKPGSEKSVWKTFKKKIYFLCSPAIRRPFFLIAMGHFAALSSTLIGMRSYLIEILRTMQVPMKPELFTFLNSIFMTCGGFVCYLAVKFMGKRFVLIASLIATSLMCLVLGWYTFYMDRMHLSWIPMISILIINMAMNIGPLPIPWMLISEVFPLKGRSIGVGMAGASSYVISFSLSKSFYTLNGLLGLSGCFLFYGSCGLLCVVYIYFQLPETEGKTLAEIEEYFSKIRRKPNLDVT